MKNKKGFTLIELLAVIVILAVVMLIGVTAVLPLIAKAQKNSLASEGLALIDTGKTAYNAEQLATSELKLAPNASYCFSLDWLRNHNYYDKASNKYSGSVLILANKSGKYDYYFWITNGNYHISGGTADNYSVEDGPGDENIYKCGGFDFDNNGGNNGGNGGGGNVTPAIDTSVAVTSFSQSQCDLLVQAEGGSADMDYYCEGTTVYTREDPSEPYSSFEIPITLYSVGNDVLYAADDEEAPAHYTFENGYHVMDFTISYNEDVQNNNLTYLNNKKSEYRVTPLAKVEYYESAVQFVTASEKTITLNLVNNTIGEVAIVYAREDYIELENGTSLVNITLPTGVSRIIFEIPVGGVFKFKFDTSNTGSQTIDAYSGN